MFRANLFVAAPEQRPRWLQLSLRPPVGLQPSPTAQKCMSSSVHKAHAFVGCKGEGVGVFTVHEMLTLLVCSAHRELKSYCGAQLLRQRP